jgi:NAD(P)-dependent dehydrogenase (short-subunit alcohol dehydrogenase family)
MRAISERTILITGATDGLGRETARALARQRAALLLSGRHRERGESLVEELAAEGSGARPRLYLADLGSLDQVRRLAAEIEAGNDRLDTLVNNAGIGSTGVERALSEDGHELTFAVNYLSHFLLTELLVPLLRRSSPSRIVNVASVGQAAIDFDDPMLERGYEGFRAYRQSKLAQIMFTFDLAERLDPSEVTVNAVHPASLMDTRMVRESFGAPRTSVAEGVEAVLHLIASPDLDGVSGRYFDGTQESAAHEQAYDPEARRRLRVLSERLVGIGQTPAGI